MTSQGTMTNFELNKKPGFEVSLSPRMRRIAVGAAWRFLRSWYPGTPK